MSDKFLCLFEPEIPANIGSIIRLSVCFGAKLAIIRPVGFIWDPSKLARSAMDYFQHANIVFFDSFDDFKAEHNGRIIATAVGFGKDYSSFDFQANDAILMGKESSGLPKEIYTKVDDSVTINIQARSLNLAIASAILLAHANIK